MRNGAEADEVLVVCLPTSFGNRGGFDDNVYGKCCSCDVEIHWRPHAPAGLRMCMACARGLPSDTLVAVTPQTAEEIRRWLSSRSGGSDA